MARLSRNMFKRKYAFENDEDELVCALLALVKYKMFLGVCSE